LRLKAGEAAGDVLEPLAHGLEMVQSLPEPEIGEVVGDQLVAQIGGKLAPAQDFLAEARQRQSREAAAFEPTLAVATRELGDAVEIRVRDNGVGIPAEIRDKLFQPF
jgi:nitrogen fixation/metabolism regulation signal transduction histidine kinase